MNRSCIEEAAQRHAEAEGSLYRLDGSRVYGEQEHAERERSIKAQHRAEFDRIEAQIGERVERAEAALLGLEHADPAASLSTSEVQRASAVADFIRDDVERLSHSELVKRCRAALNSADRRTQFALAHHVARRAGEEEDLGLAEELGELVAQLRHTLAPGQEEKIEAAREAVAEVHSLRDLCYLRRRGARDVVDLYVGDAYGHLSGQG